MYKGGREEGDRLVARWGKEKREERGVLHVGSLERGRESAGTHLHVQTGSKVGMSGVRCSIGS